MRENLKQQGNKNPDGTTTIPNDWYPGNIPPNVELGADVYIDSAYGFDSFHSRNPRSMSLGKASACYDRSTFITHGNAKIQVGDFSILNGTTLICAEHIFIGNYVMLAWGSVICDNFLGNELNETVRAKVLEDSSHSQFREMPFSNSSPITIGDNVWVGFDAIILPGTTIGRGSVIGCKSVVSGNIPEYSVVVGNPGKIISRLEPTDQIKVP